MTKIDNSQLGGKIFITWAWLASTTIIYNDPVDVSNNFTKIPVNMECVLQNWKEHMVIRNRTKRFYKSISEALLLNKYIVQSFSESCHFCIRIG
jgi:hypothetical protein